MIDGTILHDESLTNTLAKQSLSFMSAINELDSSLVNSLNNRLILDDASDMLTVLLRHDETSMAALSVDNPTLLTNRANIRSAPVDFHRTSMSKDGSYKFFIRNDGDMWGRGSNTHVTFFHDYKHAFVADGSNTPLYKENPKAWNDWIDGIDVSGDPPGSSTYTDANGDRYPSVNVRMKDEFRQKLGTGISLEGYFFNKVTNEFGIQPFFKYNGKIVSNLKHELQFGTEHLHIMLANTVYSMVSRFGRVYDTGSIHAIDEAFTAPGGMRFEVINGKLQLEGDPKVVWGSVFPHYTDLDWDVMKLNFEVATGQEFTIANVMGYTALEFNGHYVTRIKDMKTPDSDMVAATAGDIMPGASDWEDYGHYMAYYVQPRQSTLDSLKNTGMKNALPFPGVVLDPNEPTIGNGRVWFLRFGDGSNRKSFRAAMKRSASEGNALSFHHWMDDKSTKKMINWIHTIEGNWGSAPYMYIIEWYSLRVASLLVSYQIKGLQWLWHLLDDIWGFADDI